MIRRIALVATTLLCCIGATSSGVQVVRQQDRKFSVATLQARVGDTIVFANDDPYVHNIFSMSDAQSFDLGAFGKGESRKLTLKSPGRIEVGCAIHPEMKLTIEVRKSK
jgi:plastocyanin